MTFETFITIALIFQVIIAVIPFIAFYNARKLYKGMNYFTISIIIHIMATFLILTVDSKNEFFSLLLPNLLIILVNIMVIRGFYIINQIKVPYKDILIFYCAAVISVFLELIFHFDPIIIDTVMSLVNLYLYTKFMIYMIKERNNSYFKTMIPTIIIVILSIGVIVFKEVILIMALHNNFVLFSDSLSLILLGLQLALFLGFIQASLFVIQKRSVDGYIKQKNALEIHANYDALTGIPNRRLLLSTFDFYTQSKTTFALRMIDVDNFKTINDTYGHEIVDLVLRTIAERLMVIQKEEDFISRYGGDEFLIMITEKEVLKKLDLKISRMMENLAKPIMLKQGDLRFTLSVGIALYPENGSSLNALREKADFAMYKVKKSSKNGFSFLLRMI